jgi:hypothetical protein
MKKEDLRSGKCEECSKIYIRRKSDKMMLCRSCEHTVCDEWNIGARMGSCERCGETYIRCSYDKGMNCSDCEKSLENDLATKRVWNLVKIAAREG